MISPLMRGLRKYAFFVAGLCPWTPKRVPVTPPTNASRLKQSAAVRGMVAEDLAKMKNKKSLHQNGVAFFFCIRAG